MIIFQTNEINRLNGIKTSLQSFCRLESTALLQRQKLLNDLKEAVEVMDCNYDVNLFIEVEKKSDVSHKFCKALSLLDADFRNRVKVTYENDKKQKLNDIKSSVVSSTQVSGGNNGLKNGALTKIKNHENENENEDNNSHYYQNKNENKDKNIDENEDENKGDDVNQVKNNLARSSIDRSSFDVTPSEAVDHSNSNSNSNSIDDYGFQSQLLSLLQLDFSSRKETIPISNENNESVTKYDSQQKIFNDEKFECGNITHMIQTEHTESKLLNEKKNNDYNLKEREKERERENNLIKKKSADYEKAGFSPGPIGHSPGVMSPSRSNSSSGSGSGTALSMGLSRLRPSQSTHTNTHSGIQTGTHATINMKSSSSMNTTTSNSNNVTAVRASSNGVNGSWETALIAAQACQSDEVPLFILII